MPVNKTLTGAAALVGAAFFSLCTAGTALAGPARIPEGLSVEDRSLAGLTAQEAMKEASDYVQDLLGRRVVLQTEGTETVTTAEALGLSWTNRQQVEEAVVQYENSNLVERYMLQEDWAQEPVSIPVETQVEEGQAEAFVEEHLAGLGQPAVDAAITRENGEFVITPEQAGVTVDVEGTIQALNQALGAKDGQGEIDIAVQAEMTTPEITAEKLSVIQDVLGTFSTDFSSSGSARATNLQVGAEKINGHVLMPGETLSGYECLHPFTEENGYKAAASYENGQVVDSIGGGVCQLSTTLYNAALYAELEITQRQNHSMVVGYVAPSRDAAIAGTYKDLKITNPYDTPIYVEGYTSGRTLTFTIYGQETRPENRQVEFVSETIARVDPGAPKEVLNSSLAPGARQQVQSAHVGLRSRLWKVVTVDGVEQERTLLSTDTYQASPAVVQVGPPLPAAPQTQPASDPAQTADPAGTEPVQGNPGETAAGEIEMQPQQGLSPEGTQESGGMDQPEAAESQPQLPSDPAIPETAPEESQPVQEPVLESQQEQIPVPETEAEAQGEQIPLQESQPAAMPAA